MVLIQELSLYFLTMLSRTQASTHINDLGCIE
jgi:hypothetical protein